jgi:hypothetical protein
MIIKIAIGIFLLLGLAFLMRAYSTFANSSPELGVFMIQPSTSLVSFSASSSTPARGFEEFGHACGGPNGSFITGYTAYDGKRLSLWGQHIILALKLIWNSKNGFRMPQKFKKSEQNIINWVRSSGNVLLLSSSLKITR